MKSLPLLSLALGALTASAGIALAQDAPAGPTNLLKNGDFEGKPTMIDNLLDGVDKSNKLKAGLVSVKVLGAAGKITDRRLPPSVALIDLNKDGKTDVVCALPEGFIYVYFNIGEANAPKFGNAEILPVFYSKVNKQDNEFVEEEIWYDRRAPRIGFGEWTKPGALDLVIGNLFGQLYLNPSTINTPNQVSYVMPRNKDSAEIPTTKAEGRYWGNLFSPLIVNWDGDQYTDIVMGEGSYSANSVFLLRSKSGAMPPRFAIEEDRYFLVTGDGREQLVPALVDYNGDGKQDLLVADREGLVTLHVRPDNWKLGDTLPVTSTISIGGKEKRNQAITIATGDYNNDGLFDILVGEASGNISIAVNEGSAQEPKFPKLEQLSGVDVWSDNMSIGPSWSFNDASEDGNPLGYSRVVTNETDPNAQITQGTQALFMGNLPSLNKIVNPGPRPNMAQDGAEFILSQGVRIEQGKKYTVEVLARGNKVGNMRAYFHQRVRGAIPAKVQQDARGRVPAAQQRQQEWWSVQGRLTPGPQWRVLKYTFTARLKNKGLADVKGWGTSLQLRFHLDSPDSYLYVDDIKMYAED